MKSAELEAARLGFLGYLRRKRFSPQFIARHGEELFATATLEYSRKVAEGAEIDNPGGFIVACASQRTKNLLEAEKRLPRFVSTERAPTLSGEDGSAEDVALEEDRFRQVRTAVVQLSEDERRLIALSYFEGYAVREAARKLEWHPSRAQRCHRTARKRLLELLGVESLDELEVEIGLAAYLSVAADVSTGSLLERAVQRSAEGLASLKEQIVDGGAQLKQHAATAYYRAVDPSPLAAARPGTVAAVVAGCIAIGGSATYCVEQGVSPVGAARGLIASTAEPEIPPSTEPPDSPPAPVYTPIEPPESEVAPAPVEPTEPTKEKAPEPQPEPPAPREPEEEPWVPSARPPNEGEPELAENPEAPREPAPVEGSQREPAPAAPGPQFGGL